MTLYIIRHAEAEDQSPSGDDATRALTERGIARTEKAAQGLARMKLGIATVLTSPLKRAVQTAQIIADKLDLEARSIAELATGVGAAQALAALKGATAGEIIAVGHQPQLGQVVSLMLMGKPELLRTGLTTGACVAIEFAERIEAGAGVLLWMMTQKQLGKYGKSKKS